MQAKLQEQLSPADAEVILGRLPERKLNIRSQRRSKWRSPVFSIQKH
ncbi:hypothetical protein [Microcoleus sp. PH2017_32_RDM_D_A]|nr:hypothetical protein [Microcoleus sp. PH2017_32_RDM_D_A]MCC3581259.1 hypothetical protein [Microcoleus sp. PH2017_32_RDM_D_A]